MIKTHIITHGIAKTQIQKLTTAQIQKFMNEKSKEKRTIVIKGTATKSKENISARTVNLLHFLISSSLEQAIKNNLISKNPAKYCNRLSNNPKEIKALTNDQVLALLNAAKKHPLYPALIIALHTGVRRGEVLGLTWENINLDEETINITQNLVRVKGGKAIQKPKTKSSIRTIPINNIVKNIISSIKEENSTGLVFTTRNNQPIHPRSFQRTFKTWCKNSDLPKETRIHDLRHTFSTNLINAGVDIKTVQGFTGHADTRTLLDTYAHTIDDSKRKAADIIKNITPTI
jgi:integrase